MKEDKKIIGAEDLDLPDDLEQVLVPISQLFPWINEDTMIRVVKKKTLLENKHSILCPSCDGSMLEGQKICSSCKDIHRHAMITMRENK